MLPHGGLPELQKKTSPMLTDQVVPGHGRIHLRLALEVGRLHGARELIVSGDVRPLHMQFFTGLVRHSSSFDLVFLLSCTIIVMTQYGIS